MKLSDKQRSFIDTVQWVLIGVLIVLCGIVFIGNGRLKKAHNMHRENMYIRIYNSQRIAELEKKNRELSDSIFRMNQKLKESTVRLD